MRGRSKSCFLEPLKQDEENEFLGFDTPSIEYDSDSNIDIKEKEKEEEDSEEEKEEEEEQEKEETEKKVEKIKNSGKKDLFNWPEDEALQLINAIKAELPKKDNLTFKTRKNRINFDIIKIPGRTTNEIKLYFDDVVRKVRGYRIMKEILSDIETFVVSKNKKQIKNQSVKSDTEKVSDGKAKTPINLFAEKVTRETGIKQYSAIKDEWNKLPLEKKIPWIRMALTMDISRPDDEKIKRRYITKDEIKILNKYEGKPKKPLMPYQMFVQKKYHSKELESLPHVDKIKMIGFMWKNMSPEKKQEYVSETEKFMEKYALDYAKYLKNLPKERQLQEKEELKKKPRKNNTSKNISKESGNDEIETEEEEDDIVVNNKKNKLEISKIKSPKNVIISPEKKDEEERKTKHKKGKKETAKGIKKNSKNDNADATLEKSDKKLNIKEQVDKNKSILEENSVKKDQKRSPTKRRKAEKENESLIKKKKLSEPEKPPPTVFEYYKRQVYKGPKSQLQSKWEKVSNEKKKEYYQIVKKQLEIYVQELEVYLKSLNTDEMVEFSKKLKDEAAA